jgi:hypothetical protein
MGNPNRLSTPDREDLSEDLNVPVLTRDGDAFVGVAGEVYAGDLVTGIRRRPDERPFVGLLFRRFDVDRERDRVRTVCSDRGDVLIRPGSEPVSGRVHNTRCRIW